MRAFAVLPLLFAAATCLGLAAQTVWTRDTTSGATEWGSYNRSLALFVPCGSDRVEHVQNGDRMTVHPGPCPSGLEPPTVDDAQTLFASASRIMPNEKIDANRFKAFLRTESGANFVNALRAGNTSAVKTIYESHAKPVPAITMRPNGRT